MRRANLHLRRLPPLCLLAAALLPALLPPLAGCSGEGPLPAAPETAAPAAPDPTLPGPFPVGNLCLYLTDPARHDNSTDSDRQLLVEVWYPAAAEAEAPRTRIVDFIDPTWAPLVEAVFGLLLPPEEMEYFYRDTASVPGASPDLEHGPYPLILFSHGNGGVRFQNHTLACHLASHGFVFAAPDHTENAAFTALPDQLVIFNPLLMPKSFLDRPQDLTFVLDELLRRTAPGSGDRLEGAVDPDRVSAVGHSFGGLPVMVLAQFEPRIRSGITLAGPWISLALFHLEVPMMYMIGLEDRTVGVPYNEWIRDVYERSPAPKFFVEFPDGGHYTFTDACGIAPTLFGSGDGCGEGTRIQGGAPFVFVDYLHALAVQNAYMLAFLEYTLNGDVRYEPWLAANHFPETILHSCELR